MCFILNKRKNNDVMKGLHDEIARFLRSLIDFRHQNLANPLNIHGATSTLLSKYNLKADIQCFKMAFVEKFAWASFLYSSYVSEHSKWDLKRSSMT